MVAGACGGVSDGRGLWAWLETGFSWSIALNGWTIVSAYILLEDNVYKYIGKV